MACYSCMDACPAPGALRMETAPGRRAVSAGLYAALIAAAFLITPVLAHALGYWNSDMSAQDFKQLYAIIENIQHPRTGGVNPGAMPAAAMGGHAGAIPHSVMPPSVDSAMQLPPGARPDLCPGMNPDSPLAEDLKEARRRLEQKNTDESDKAPVSNNPL